MKATGALQPKSAGRMRTSFDDADLEELARCVESRLKTMRALQIRIRTRDRGTAYNDPGGLGWTVDRLEQLQRKIEALLC